MRRAFFLLIGFLVALGAAFLALRYLATHGGSGYVIVGIGQWSVETTLLLTSVVLALSFLLLYFAIRIVITAVNLPKTLRTRSHEQRSKRSQ